MRTVADVSTDDLVNSLLNSVSTSSPSTKTSAPSTASSPSSASTSSASSSHSAASASTDEATTAPSTTSPATPSPATTVPPTTQTDSTTGSKETATGGTSEGSGDGGGGTGLSIGIAVGVLALVVAALLFLRSRRKRAAKTRESMDSPPAGAVCLTVPADRGFKKEQELGMPEMSIELPPGELGMSKGFDMSYVSSTRSSTASNQFNASVASSTDSSVFNTRGGVSPTTFSSRKMASFSYQYRESEENGGNANNPNASQGNSTLHLTGLIGNGQTTNSNPSRAPGSRKLSAPDEYAELVTATNAHGQVDMSANNQTPQPIMHADFTQSTTSQNTSMGPDGDNQSFLAPLPTRAAPVRAPAPTQPRQGSTIVRASEESMGPDSPVAGRGKRTGSVYDTLPKLSGEKMSTRSSEEDPHAMSTASFLSESSISSTSTRDSVATSARGSAYVSSMPLLQQLFNATDSDYGEDLSSERASTESSDSGNTTRSGSLIALNLEAKDGCSEIAI